jgi:hypothetical protein
MLGAELVQVAQIVADAVRRDGRVFPRGPAGVLARDLAVAHAPLADLPHLCHLV